MDHYTKTLNPDGTISVVDNLEVATALLSDILNEGYNARKILNVPIDIEDFTGLDGYILAYDEANNKFYLKADEGGGGGVPFYSLGDITASAITAT